MESESELDELIFNSKTEPIPGLREDLDIIPLRENGSSYLYFHDVRGYATPNFALDSKAQPILSLLDGRRTIKGFRPYLGDGVTEAELLDYIRFLDENRLLNSNYFKIFSRELEERYEANTLHQSNTAGLSYPADPRQLRTYLDNAFSTTALPGPPQGKIRALYAPHIDLRVGLDSYVRAFAPLRDIKPKRVVLLATSHYAGYYPNIYRNQPFITTKKTFELPLGLIQADREVVDELVGSSKVDGLSASDRAHRIEHSIELHLLFLSYLWNHTYQIVPILVQGFDELYYADEPHLARQIEELGRVLRTAFGADEETFFLISGDLAHVGRKFGDNGPARDLFEEVREFDEQFLNFATQSDDAGLLSLMKEEYDPYRICGFPPLYTFLKSLPGLKGHRLSYDLWDEAERQSAVSFASVLYTE